MDRPLKPGEVNLGPPCSIHGVRPFTRRREDGTLEMGATLPAGTGRATAFWDLEPAGGDAPPNVHRIKTEIRYTSHGSRAATSAYRSGWDETFGRKDTVS